MLFLVLSYEELVRKRASLVRVLHFDLPLSVLLGQLVNFFKQVGDVNADCGVALGGGEAAVVVQQERRVLRPEVQANCHLVARGALRLLELNPSMRLLDTITNGVQDEQLPFVFLELGRAFLLDEPVLFWRVGLLREGECHCFLPCL